MRWQTGYNSVEKKEKERNRAVVEVGDKVKGWSFRIRVTRAGYADGNDPIGR